LTASAASQRGAACNVARPRPMAAAESSACGRGNAVNPSGVVLVQLRPTLPDIIRPTYYIVHVFINQLALSSYYDVHIMVAIFSDNKIIKRFTHRSGYLHINADKRQDDIFDTQTRLTSYRAARRYALHPPTAADLRPCANGSTVFTALVAWPRRRAQQA